MEETKLKNTSNVRNINEKTRVENSKNEKYRDQITH